MFPSYSGTNSSLTRYVELIWAELMRFYSQYLVPYIRVLLNAFPVNEILEMFVGEKYIFKKSLTGKAE